MQDENPTLLFKTISVQASALNEKIQHTIRSGSAIKAAYENGPANIAKAVETLAASNPLASNQINEASPLSADGSQDGDNARPNPIYSGATGNPSIRDSIAIVSDRLRTSLAAKQQRQEGLQTASSEEENIDDDLTLEAVIDQHKSAWAASAEEQSRYEESLAGEDDSSQKQVTQDSEDVTKIETKEEAKSDKTSDSRLLQRSKRRFDSKKKKRIAGVMVESFDGAIKAFASQCSISVVGGLLGAMAGASVLMNGLSQAAQIRAEKFEPRALGGPVFAGKTYLVGELGPEIFSSPGEKNRIALPSDRSSDNAIRICSLEEYLDLPKNKTTSGLFAQNPSGFESTIAESIASGVSRGVYRGISVVS